MEYGDGFEPRSPLLRHSITPAEFHRAATIKETPLLWME
jgi:hypothetical protein